MSRIRTILEDLEVAAAEAAGDFAHTDDDHHLARCRGRVLGHFNREKRRGDERISELYWTMATAESGIGLIASCCQTARLESFAVALKEDAAKMLAVRMSGPPPELPPPEPTPEPTPDEP